MQFTPAQQHATAWTGLAAAAALVLWLLGPVLMPFVVASVLAYALSPLVHGAQRACGGRLPRLVAVVLVEFVFLLLLVALLTLLVPILAHELPRMRDQLPVLVERLQTEVVPWLRAKGVHVALDSANLKAMVLQLFNTSFDDGFKQALTSLRIGGSVALAVVGNLVLIPVVLFYLLLDWKRFVRHVEALVPVPARAAYDSFVTECDDVLGQYLRGQLSVMALLAVSKAKALMTSEQVAGSGAVRLNAPEASELMPTAVALSAVALLAAAGVAATIVAVGSMSIIGLLRGEDGVLWGGSDPRADGCAMSLSEF